MTISLSSTATHPPIDKEQAIKMAKRFLIDEMGSYQIMPLDEYGNIDWESYEPGCTPWNIRTSIEITSAEIAEYPQDEQDDWTVVLLGVWAWSEDDNIETDFHFEVYIPKDSDLNCAHDFEFDRYS